MSDDCNHLCTVKKKTDLVARNDVKTEMSHPVKQQWCVDTSLPRAESITPPLKMTGRERIMEGIMEVETLCLI